MEQLTNLVTRIGTLARSAISWLTLISTVLVAVAGYLTDAVIDDGLGSEQALDTASAWILRVVAFIAVIIAQVRRVTPVPEQQRGLLPTPPQEG